MSCFVNYRVYKDFHFELIKTFIRAFTLLVQLNIIAVFCRPSCIHIMCHRVHPLYFVVDFITLFFWSCITNPLKAFCFPTCLGYSFSNLDHNLRECVHAYLQSQNLYTFSQSYSILC